MTAARAIAGPIVDPLVRDIQEAIESGDRVRQSLLVRRSAEALTRRWSRLPVESKADYDLLLAALIGLVDESARRAFALRIAPLRKAPPRTAMLLAQDRSVRVAEPLLSECRSFNDGWFEALAGSCGNLHRAAIARRRGLGVALCNALVRLGDADVIAVLLSNPDAAISAEALPQLMRYAQQSESVAVRLTGRRDLPAACREPLTDLALRRARTALAAEVELDPGLAAELPARIAATLALPVEPARHARFDASMSLGDEARGPAVTSARLERWIELRRVEDVLATLALNAGLPIAPVVAAYDADDMAALAVLVRGLDHPWSTLKALLNTRFRDAIVLEMLTLSHTLMQELAPGTARRLVRYAMALQDRAAYVAQLPG